MTHWRARYPRVVCPVCREPGKLMPALRGYFVRHTGSKDSVKWYRYCTLTDAQGRSAEPHEGNRP